MNCEQARGVMQDVLDGTQADHAELDAHCAECPQCRAEWRQLQAIASAVRADVRCDVPVECRDRVIAGALRRIEFQQGHVVRDVRWVRGVATAALLIAVFATGLYAGRTVWPREVIVTKTVMVPEVREKIVEVKVPVVQEKVVIKRVPVYKTRIVYLDREVKKPVPVVTPPETPALLTPDQFVTQPESEPLMTAVTVFQETRPAQLAEEVEPEQLEPTQGRHDSPGTTIAQATTRKITTKSNAPTS